MCNSLQEHVAEEYQFVFQLRMYNASRARALYMYTIAQSSAIDSLALEPAG